MLSVGAIRFEDRQSVLKIGFALTKSRSAVHMAAALASRLYSCTVPYNMSSVHHHVLRRIVLYCNIHAVQTRITS